MKMNKLITTAAVLALIGLASVEKASAITSGDLVLDFRQNDSGSGGTSLEFDLGTASSVLGNSAGATIANVSAGLTAVYGSGWASETDLVWSLVGASTGNIYITNPGDAVSYNSTQLESTAHVNNITPLYGSSGGTVESDGSIAVPNLTSVSYDNVLTHVDGGTAYSGDYGVISGGFGQSEQAIGSTSDLDLATFHNIADEGTFEVNSSGQLILNPVAVPEPASYVLGGIAAVLFVIMHRRSKIRA